MAKVLVTGGAGFFGKTLVPVLGAHHQVLAPRRAELDLLDGDAVAAFLARERPDVVVHNATTPGHRNAPRVPELAVRNLRMFFHLAQGLGASSRFVLIGSGAEYDQSRCPPKVREDQLGELVPSEESAVSKFALSKFAATDGRFTVLRPFGMYGPHEDWEIRFLSNAICKAMFGKPITLRQNRRFDYVSAGDAARVVLAFVDRPGAHPSYNLTPDEPVELVRAAELVREVCGAQIEIRVGAPGLGREYSGSNQRLRAQLPGFEFTPLVRGLEALHRFWSDHRQQIRPDLLDNDK